MGVQGSYFLFKFIGNQSFVIEETEVDKKTGIMTCRSRNISHTRFVSAEEIYTFTRDTENNEQTFSNCQFVIKSKLGFGMEKFGMKRVKEKMINSRIGFISVLESLGKSYNF